MTKEEEDDPYVIHGSNLSADVSEEDEDDPYVIHGKNLVAEVSVAGHADLVKILEGEGISVSRMRAVDADIVRIRISGHSATLNHTLIKLRDQNPQIRLRIVDDVDDED